MAIASGQRTTGNIGSSQRKIDMHKEILLLEPDAGPLLQISKSMSRQRASDPLFSWHNDAAEQRFDAVNNGAGYADNATSIVVDTGTAFAKHFLVYVPRTGELLQVDSVSTNTLTVDRGVGGSTAAALVDNDPLLIVGVAGEEGDASEAPRSENPTKVDNYTQIFKTSVQSSATLLSSANESNPHDWRHQQKKKMIEHKKDIEYAFLVGKPGTQTGPNGLPQRSTGGILHYAAVNRTAVGGALTLVEVESWLATLFRYGSNKKTVFVSSNVLAALNMHALNKLQTVSGTSTFGVSVMNWVSAFGEIKLVHHHLLEGAILGGYAIAIDFAGGAVAYRYLHGEGAPGGSRDTHIEEDVISDVDGRRDEIITECGLQAGLPYVHGVLTGSDGTVA